MVIDLSSQMTQAQFGELVGITQPAVSDLVRSGGLPAAAPAGEMLRAYCARLRGVAAGRGDGSLELTRERAQLTRAQRVGVEIKNSVMMGEYAPISQLARILATASQGVAEQLDQLPATLRKTCPDMPEAARDQVMETISRARNNWVAQTIQLVVAQVLGDSDEGQGPAEVVE